MNSTTEPVAMTSSDEEALRRLTHEYCRAVDLSDLDGLMELWLDDAVWDVTNFGMGVVTGAGAIREFFQALVDNTTHRCHLALNHLIDVEGDHASAMVYVHAFVVDGAGNRDESLGYYEDRYARTHAGWKFRSRTVHPLLPPPGAPVQ